MLPQRRPRPRPRGRGRGRGGDKTTTRRRTRPRNPIADEVEEELRKQRRERQNDDKDVDDGAPLSRPRPRPPQPAVRVRPATLGRFVFDAERGAYFPKGTAMTDEDPVLLAQRRQSPHNHQFHHHHPYANIPKRSRNAAVLYGLASEVCRVSSVRRRIAAHWRGHVFLAGIDVDEFDVDVDVDASTSHAVTVTTPIIDDSAPNRHGFVAFAPTASLESVVWYARHDPTRLLRRVRAFRATAGRLEEKEKEKEEWLMSCRMPDDKPISSIKQNTRGDIVVLSDRHQSLTCFKHSIKDMIPAVTQRTTRERDRRNHCINDFAIHPCDADFTTTAMAHDKGRWSLNKLDRIAVVASRNITASSPSSDILSIEIWHERDNDNAVLCGHRNGQLSMGDLRTGTTVWHSPPAPQFGNIALIRPLGGGRFSFLAKNNGGVCRLYDIRGHGKTDDGPLFTMTSPGHVGTCKGMATDQGDSLLINAVQAGGDGGGCALEVWSLLTGEFIDTRTIATNGRPIELGSTTTQNRHSGTSLWIARHERRILQVHLKERYLLV